MIEQEKMLSEREATGILDVLVDYLMNGEGPLSAEQRKAIGRMLSEYRYTISAKDPPRLKPV